MSEGYAGATSSDVVTLEGQGDGLLELLELLCKREGALRHGGWARHDDCLVCSKLDAVNDCTDAQRQCDC